MSNNSLKYSLTFPDSVALSIPREASLHTRTLVSYLKNYLYTQDDLARAIYTWVSRNIKYNVYTTFTSRNEEVKEEKVLQKILSEQKGVCQHYALIFKALIEEAGMGAFIINGYNKVNGVLLPDPHQWCAAKAFSKRVFRHSFQTVKSIIQSCYQKEVTLELEFPPPTRKKERFFVLFPQ